MFGSAVLSVSISCALALASAGCGHRGEPSGKGKDDAGAAAAAAPLAMPVLGVDQVRRFNYLSEAGSPANERAAAAWRKHEWATVRSQSEIALGKDPMHLGAHRLLAAAMAQTGEPAAAVDHLVAALAADFYQYEPQLVDDDLKSFMTSPHGQSVAALAGKIRDEYARRIAGALWLVGRSQPFKWPREFGVQTSNSHGELYAFDRETRRYFRLTHTEQQVAGFVRAGAANEVAVFGFDKIDRPRPDGTSDAPPILARPWIQLFDTQTWRSITPRINLPAAREVELGYAAGDQLLVSTAQATGRWTVGDPVVSSVDRTTGKLTKVAAALPPTHLVMSLDEGHLVRVPDDGVVASWTGDPPTTPNLKTPAGKPIAIPESGAAAQASVALAPGGAHVAFATAVDPCAKDAAPSLYVADTAAGTYRHLLSAKSRFPTRWLDRAVLAYEDGEGGIRLWDATTGRQMARLEARPGSSTGDRSGLALDVLSLAAAPLCKQAPPTVDAAGSGDEMPPEEPSGSGAPPAAPGSPAPPAPSGSGAPGPVTAPQ